jgi:hypothetical protein
VRRRRVDARGTQDLPHGGRCHGDAEFRQLTVDPAVHRPSRRAADGNGEDGSGANAAEAFTTGLLGALYRLRQRKLALRELNAEGLTAILDTTLHASAGNFH